MLYELQLKVYYATVASTVSEQIRYVLPVFVDDVTLSYGQWAGIKQK